jgi:hypothetical protein
MHSLSDTLLSPQRRAACDKPAANEKISKSIVADNLRAFAGQLPHQLEHALMIATGC